MEAPGPLDYGHTPHEHGPNWPAITGVALLAALVLFVLLQVAR